jgi:DNA-binding NarL/FixJ family response regulator
MPGGLIRILLADDHVMFREGTAELLRRAPDLVVVAEAGDGQRAVELADTLKPDVVIMDVHLPMLSGIEATRRIRQSSPEVHVLVLSAYDDDQYVISLLQAGASGYLLKTAPISELIRAIYQVHAGELPFDPRVMRKLVLHVSGHLETPAAVSHRPAASEPLTEREMGVLQLLAQGLSNREIAQRLSISHRTVQAHLTQLFDKMHVSSRLDAVLTAIRWGWLDLER